MTHEEVEIEQHFQVRDSYQERRRRSNRATLAAWRTVAREGDTLERLISLLADYQNGDRYGDTALAAAVLETLENVERQGERPNV